ncbi:unnamed protein product [Cladocopium goreaui]|uniref:Modification methylase HaeII n=1 Tax=Cladocopium goreaui TaxID=2562237 RepID=A0A9P1DRV9_9DINO|nr:unnamed protein product [Cladocopium goreaui]
MKWLVANGEEHDASASSAPTTSEEKGGNEGIEKTELKGKVEEIPLANLVSVFNDHMMYINKAIDPEDDTTESPEFKAWLPKYQAYLQKVEAYLRSVSEVYPTLFQDFRNYMLNEIGVDPDIWAFGDPVESELDSDLRDWRNFLSSSTSMASTLTIEVGRMMKIAQGHPIFDDGFVGIFKTTQKEPNTETDNLILFEDWVGSLSGPIGFDEFKSLHHKFPLPPCDGAPDINDLLESAAEAEAMVGVDISAALRSLPRKIYMGDLFSGTGSCTLVSKTLFGQLKKLYPEECEGMVVHEFMCEKEPYKRRFLEEAFPDEDCCIFKDATELYTDKRACARHDKGGGCQCEIPDELLILTAGFSCKSFSKMNPEYSNLLDAIRTDNKDSSSAQTFNGTCKVLDETEVQAFILENVDLNDDDDSNLDNILKALSQIGGGFRVRAFKLYSTDFGIRSVAADFSSSASPRSHREKRPWRKLSRCCEVFVSKGKHPTHSCYLPTIRQWLLNVSGGLMSSLPVNALTKMMMVNPPSVVRDRPKRNPMTPWSKRRLSSGSHFTLKWLRRDTRLNRLN